MVALVGAVLVLGLILVVCDDRPAAQRDAVPDESGSSARRGSARDDRAAAVEIGRLLPVGLPEAFEPVAFRLVPDDAPAFAGSRVELVLYGAADGSGIHNQDLGVIAVRSSALPGAVAFAPDQTPIEVGDDVGYRSEIGPPENVLTRVARDGDDGLVIVAASHSIDAEGLARVVAEVDVEDARPRVPRSVVPDGLDEIARGDASFVVFGRPPATAEGYEVQYARRSEAPARIVFSRWRDDAPWEVMVRWWFGIEGETVSIGGDEGLVVDLGTSVGDVAESDGEASGGATTSSAPPPASEAPGESTLVGWRDDGVTTILIGHGIAREDVLRAARSVQPAGDAEWSRVAATGG